MEKSKTGRSITVLGKVAMNNLTEKCHFSTETSKGREQASIPGRIREPESGVYARNNKEAISRNGENPEQREGLLGVSGRDSQILCKAL